jgi:hypothetical protein
MRKKKKKKKGGLAASCAKDCAMKRKVLREPSQ